MGNQEKSKTAKSNAEKTQKDPKHEENPDRPELDDSMEQGSNLSGEGIEELTIIQQELSEKNDANIELTKKLLEYEDLIKRTQADFLNYRQKALKERENTIQSTKADVIREFLPIVDSFEKAVEAYKGKEAHVDVDSLIQSLEMMEKQIKDILAKQGVKEIPAAEQEFNPMFHIAMQMDESKSGEFDEDTVTQVLQKGYTLGDDKVIRHSTVIVAKGKPGNPIQKEVPIEDSEPTKD